MIELFKLTGLSDLTLELSEFQVEHCSTGAMFNITYGFIDDAKTCSERCIINLEHADSFIATNASLSESDAILIADAAYFLRSSNNTDNDDDGMPYSSKRLNEITIGFKHTETGLLEIGYDF